MSTYLVLGGHDGGIGKAITEHLAEVGHGVVATGRSTDVRDAGLVDRLISEAITRSGQDLAGIVYCAGVNRLSWLGDMGLSGLREAGDMFGVNTLGFLAVLDSVVRHTAENQEGDSLRSPSGLSILAISSDAAERPMRTSAAYCASKAALNMLVRCAARELGDDNYRINALSPGMVEFTGMSAEVDEQVQKLRGWTEEEMMEYERSQEVVPGRISPSEVARVAVDILTGPRHLNGSIITLNGGR